MTQAGYLAFLAVLALERVLELAISRRNTSRALAAGGREFGRRHYRVMAAFHTAFLIACAGEVLLLKRPFPGALGLAAFCGALFAQGLRYWAIATLGDRWNVRVIVWPDSAPVTHGPYRWIRHPNYVAVIAEMALVPLIHGAYWTALAFSAGNAALLWVRIRVEEQALGESYSHAFAQRPRFIPRPFGEGRTWHV
ncbi:MAG TPA: isoprenylcysteine carboxyl methyltransferase family protein [Myxococcaceae bacterium]|nr:isoprenylcysteine carboxyl methyltransferase family protein [Myxococcaceae bacterium]